MLKDKIQLMVIKYWQIFNFKYGKQNIIKCDKHIIAAWMSSRASSDEERRFFHMKNLAQVLFC